MSRSLKTTAVLLAILSLAACGTGQKLRGVSDV